MFMSILSVYYMCVLGPPGGQKKSIGFPQTGVTDGCTPSCGCCDSNLLPLEEQPVLITTEPSLQPRTSALNPWANAPALDLIFFFLCSAGDGS